MISADGKEENPDLDHILLPSGQFLAPLAAPGAQQQYLSAGCQPQSVAGGAMATVVSPDGKTMLVLAQVGTARDRTELPETVFWYRGSGPNSLALSPDGATLYLTNEGSNSIAAIIGLSHRPRTIGLIPTGYYPNSVSIGPDGRMLYVINGKSLARPNPKYRPVARIPRNGMALIFDRTGTGSSKPLD